MRSMHAHIHVYSDAFDFISCYLVCILNHYYILHFLICSMIACMDTEMSLFESLRRRRKRRTLTFFEKILLLTYLYIHSCIQVHWHKLPEYAAHDRGLYHFYMYIQFIETLQILIKKWIENFTIEGRSQSKKLSIHIFTFSDF